MNKIKLSSNRYGEARVRLIKVRRTDDAHEVLEWSVLLAVDGEFVAAFKDGDNSRILPSDTMKNAVYSQARNSAAESIEEYAHELIAFILDWYHQIDSVKVEIEQKSWERIPVGGSGHGTAFRNPDAHTWTTAVAGSRGAGMRTRSGIKGLNLLKTADACFSGFIKDSLTTLPEADDQLLACTLEAVWTYRRSDETFACLRARIVDILLTTFAEHKSKSLQHTVHAMGHQVLETVPEAGDIQLVMTNVPCHLVDLSPFGQDNPNEIFVPTSEPYGLIKAKLVRQ